MNSKECIVLAGGLGTRLRGVIGDQPKCMAPVGGQPFLHWLFRYLDRQGCTRCVLSLGYRHEVVLDWLQTQDLPFEVDYVIEHEPLGTGGGMVLALQNCQHEQVFVVNGDTLFNASLEDLLQTHLNADAETTLALKPMQDFERYGTVEIASGNEITAFAEKQPCQEGLINGGIYVISRTTFVSRLFPAKFSFEKDYLEATVGEGRLYASLDSGYFIDIGVPDDYERAQTEIPQVLGAS
ncbi:MAG: D-mannose-1-phosphate guanyltransferase [Sphingobacteriales bacterium]|nr:MAG: D-mannose-1-phosphate guanyltransferase [Sphingobacteriales bacterium]